MPRTRQVFSLWVVPAALLIGVGLLAALAGATIIMRPDVTPAAIGNATAVMTIISAPTSTPQPVATFISTATAGVGTPGVIIGGIGAGTYVQISGTGGDGLRLRQEPGTSSAVMFMGYEAEVFKVMEGPKDQDGYVWWYLTAPYDESRSGWAASNFLTVIELTP